MNVAKTRHAVNIWANLSCHFWACWLCAVWLRCLLITFLVVTMNSSHHLWLSLQGIHGLFQTSVIGHSTCWHDYYSFWYISNKIQYYTVYLFLENCSTCFGVVSPPIIRSTHNCVYGVWYLLNRYCYHLLLWMSW